MTSSKIIFSVAALVMLSACATKTPAPVIDRRAPAPATPTPTTVPPANKNPAASPIPERASQTPTPVPVTAPTVPASSAGKTHTVQRGETMYGIAFQNNLDYRELALWNNIENPALIKVGDVLRLTPPAGIVPPPTSTATPTAAPAAAPAITTTPTTTPQPAVAAGNTAALKAEPLAGKIPYSDAAMARANLPITSPTTAPTAPGAVAPTAPVPSIILPPSVAAPTTPVVVPPTATTAPPQTPSSAASREAVDFSWPVKGNVITTFTELNKGIDISGTRGTAVLAAAPGTVIHTGAGIRGYGRLVIVKHAGNLVSAYAHNDKIVVNEGQEVKRGQKIAEMGNSDADQVKLHFEIRRQGKPVDPMTLLPKQ
jgi:lipoprotein NlpD